MESNRYIKRIKEIVYTALETNPRGNDLTEIANYCVICCRSKQRIHRIPFFNPSLILVLSGEKTVSNGEKTESCTPGRLLGIPAPASFDMVNEPDGRNHQYLALCIEFESKLIDRFRRLYPSIPPGRNLKHAMQIKGGDTLLSTMLHFLEMAGQTEKDKEVLDHRLMEILLCLVKSDAASHLLFSLSNLWRQRLASLFMTDPAKRWRVQDVCRLLAVSESSLRRHLRQEKASYQSILDDVRLGHGLLLVQTTPFPIGRIAANCGYQSASRFSDRFRDRFRITPSRLRKTLTESV